MRVYYDRRGRRRGYSLSGGEAYAKDVWDTAGMFILFAPVALIVVLSFWLMVLMSTLGVVWYLLGALIGLVSPWRKVGRRMRSSSRRFHALWGIAGRAIEARTPQGQMKRRAEQIHREFSRLSSDPQTPLETPTRRDSGGGEGLEWRIVLQCSDGTEVLGEPRFASEHEAALAAAKARTVSQQGAAKTVRSSYLIRTAADGRWTVMYDVGNELEVPGTDRFPTPEEARAAASATSVLHVSGVPHRVKSYELVDSDGGPWRTVYECTDGSEALGFGRYASQAIADRVASGTRTATVSGEARPVRSYRTVREDAPVTRATEPWFNEVAIELADFGLTERARNTGVLLAGVPLQGDLALDCQNFSVFINLFANCELARQADLGLRAKPNVRNAIAQGLSAVKTADRIVYTASGQGRVVDEPLLGDVMVTVSKIAPPPLSETETGGLEESTPHAPRNDRGVSVSETAAKGADPLEQLRRLGELRDSGVLTAAEFEAKKATFLQQI